MHSASAGRKHLLETYLRLSGCKWMDERRCKEAASAHVQDAEILAHQGSFPALSVVVMRILCAGRCLAASSCEPNCCQGCSSRCLSHKASRSWSCLVVECFSFEVTTMHKLLRLRGRYANCQRTRQGKTMQQRDHAQAESGVSRMNVTLQSSRILIETSVFM